MNLLQLIRLARRHFCLRILMHGVESTGMTLPSNLKQIYVREHAEYVAAAIVAVNQLGE